ncbi:MAG: hypothetical protein FWD11_11220, partial [Micrococcales bacterium]|nr:hypothetical protein [Micrococcales bacterium]
LSVPQGAWYRPEKKVRPPARANGDHLVDTAGCMNTLTSLHPTPLAKGNAVHTTTADVVRA